jgi:hypothetical protein
MKIKKKSIPAIPNHPQHVVPLNLYDSAIFQTPPHVPPSSIHPVMLANMQALNQMFFNPLMYCWPLASYSKEEQDHQKTQFHAAATRIQKTFRGYRTRKMFMSLQYNPIIREKDPARYWVEHVLYEEINLTIMDSLVELAEDMYLPLRKNFDFKCHQVLGRAVMEVIYDASLEAIREAKGLSKGIKKTDQPIFESIYEDFLDVVIKEVVYEGIHDISLEYTREENISELYDFFISDIIQNDIMSILWEIELQDTADYIITEVMARLIRSISFEICPAMNIKLFMKQPRKPKSKKLDDIMESLLGPMLVEELLLESIEVDPSQDMNNVLASCIMECLLTI